MSSSLALGVVHGNILIYAFSFWLTQPVLPFLLKELSADSLLFSRFQTFCSFLQLLGGPLAGRICDAFGFSITLGISQAAAALTYALLAASSSVPLLFLSQLPTVFMHAMHAAQAAMAVLASEDMRATAMGRLSLSYGVGMVLGSYTGGAISAATSNQTSAIVAALLSFSVLPINWFTLRSDAPSSKPNQAIEKAPSSIDLYKIWEVLRQPLVWHTVAVQVLLGLALSVHRSTFSEVLRQVIALGPKDIGLVMSVGGVVSIVANGVLLQFFLSRWSERSVIFGSSVVIALSFVLYAHLPIGEGALPVLMALTVPLMGASAIAYTVLSSQMSKGAKNEDRATAIGLSHASRSACGLVAPTLGAIVLQVYGFQALGYTCAIATAISIAYAALNHAPAPSQTNKKLN